MARGQLTMGDGDSSRAVDEATAALAAFGLYAEEELDLEDDEFWLWPENEEAFVLWLGLQTQWHVGSQGATGLNYPGVETCMRLRGIRRPKDRERLFEAIQVMEQACLEEWAQRR